MWHLRGCSTAGNKYKERMLKNSLFIGSNKQEKWLKPVCEVI